MAQRVEARSLSQLNYLAANPPRYPVNPTEQKQEPLVLYISRVPGSRDVILSPFKPQLKNVTGEDVANSLYLIHLDLPTDDLHNVDVPPDPALGQSQGQENDSRSLGGSPTAGPNAQPTTAHSPIARKPLPASAKAAVHGPVSVPPMAFPNPHTPDKSSPGTAVPRRADLEPEPEPEPASRPGPGLSPTQTSVSFANPGCPPHGPPANAPDHVYLNRYGDLPADRPALPPRPLPSRPQPPSSPPPPPPRDQQQVPVARKPLGPRPQEVSPAPTTPKKDTPRPRSVGNFEGAIAAPATNNVAQAEQQPKAHAPLNDFHLRPPRSPSPSKRPRDLVPFTLTVIRRDPVTGAQWNVGKVSSFQQAGDPVAADGHTPGTGPTYAELAGVAPSAVPTTGGAAPPPAINVHIETSGYAKFRGLFPTRESLEHGGRTRAGSAASAMLARGPGAAAANGSTDSLAMEFFSRQLLMSYTKSWTSNIREVLRKGRSDSTTNPPPDDQLGMTAGGSEGNQLPPSPFKPPPRLPVRSRSGSVGSVASADLSSSPPHGSPPSTKGFGGLHALQQSLNAQAQNASKAQQSQLITTPGPGLRPRGYVFSSPWDGRCEFRTSSSGRSVKCLHSLGGLASDPSASSPPPTVISELRFNLPSSDLFRDKGFELQGNILDRLKPEGRGGAGNHHHQRGSKSVDTGHSYQYDYEDGGEVFGTELGLGRERAGGGNRGKRAKLGKLIIYDEGLKMLDLVVAANLGVWWGAWERSF